VAFSSVLENVAKTVKVPLDVKPAFSSKREKVPPTVEVPVADRVLKSVVTLKVPTTAAPILPKALKVVSLSVALNVLTIVEEPSATRRSDNKVFDKEPTTVVVLVAASVASVVVTKKVPETLGLPESTESKAKDTVPSEKSPKLI
jgi:hypothetical protein